MDELSRIWFRTECRDRLRSGQGTAFQDLFADIMELAYPRDFQRRNKGPGSLKSPRRRRS
jgi:hypothetical protein